MITEKAVQMQFFKLNVMIRAREKGLTFRQMLKADIDTARVVIKQELGRGTNVGDESAAMYQQVLANLKWLERRTARK